MFACGLLGRDPARAIAAFRRNVALHPRSANVHASLGEAHERTYARDLARACHETAAATADPMLPLFEQNLARVRDAP